MVVGLCIHGYRTLYHSYVHHKYFLKFMYVRSKWFFLSFSVPIFVCGRSLFVCFPKPTYRLFSFSYHFLHFVGNGLRFISTECNLPFQNQFSTFDVPVHWTYLRKLSSPRALCRSTSSPSSIVAFRLCFSINSITGRCSM